MRTKRAVLIAAIAGLGLIAASATTGPAIAQVAQPQVGVAEAATLEADVTGPDDSSRSAICLQRAGAMALGEVGLASTPEDQWRDAAVRDLAALILAHNTELLASAYPVISSDGTAESVAVVPAEAGVDAKNLFKAGNALLVPDYQNLVTAEDIVVQEPVGYAFTDLCHTYTLLDQLWEVDGEQLIDALSFDPRDATISFNAIPPLRQELAGTIAKAGPYVAVEFVDEFLVFDAFASSVGTFRHPNN